MSDGISHMIPTTNADAALVHRLGKSLGRKPSRAVELAIDWVIDNGIPPPDPTFKTERQIHVMLSKNYRRDHEPYSLGFYLHFGLANYWKKYQGGVPDGQHINFWPVDLPKSSVLALHRRAFDSGRDIEVEFGLKLRQAIVSILDTLPKSDPEHDEEDTRVLVPTDPDTRALYFELEERVRPYRWDPDTLIERRLSELAKVP